MGKGERRRAPIGGVTWWDEHGVRHNTQHPPWAPGIGPAICLFIFCGILFAASIPLFVIAGLHPESNRLALILVGVALLLLSVLLLLGGLKCHQKGKGQTLTLYYPGTGGRPLHGVTIEPRVCYMTG